ncbi:hypothetical protein IWQ60_011442 [Tieghemiomyces parasiticus]|uniref:Chitin-binding type-4 domain-containing protein n=1 Tax=Tieghemiomyces parasiticus TaxID=78921 RepID=A0A9W7ZJG4_9FUNG|nr:hypothetical protein IWQ60_011442 [Tieghemiomyces parasiticus]
MAPSREYRLPSLVMLKYTVLALSILSASTVAHMKPSSPCMRGSTLASCGYSSPNYDLASPIGSGGSVYLPICHHTTPYPKAVATYQAGSSIAVVFAEGGATHGGGHCEFSLSYDGGSTFVVLLTVLRTCFLNGRTFDVPVPATAPTSDRVVLSWSWVNAIGNREFYQTCSDIAIQGQATGGSITGPPMLTPNYGSGPAIGEFGNANQDDGSRYYTARPNIVVTGGGGAGGSGGGNSTLPSPPASTKAPPPSSTKVPPTLTASERGPSASTARPTPSPLPGGGNAAHPPGWSCEDAGKSPNLIANTNGSIFIIRCAGGLLCYDLGGGPYCDYASRT